MLMRSKLFVPGSRPELFEKALASAADALSFDLEDAVARDKKDEARANLVAFLGQARTRSTKTFVVRVNPAGSQWFEADVRAAVSSGVNVVNLPMVETSEEIHEAARLIDDLEPQGKRGQTRLLVNLETPKGLRCAAALAGAHKRIVGLQIGYADLFEPAGISRFDQAAVAHVRLTIRLAASEAGISAYDGAFPMVKDVEAYRAECEAARRHGFSGKSCIHPTQIAVANAAFSPSAAEIARARKILDAAARAESRGVGAYVVDGQMIDEPFLISARAIVAFADQVETDATHSGADR